jgi:hypothetical protein
MKKKNTFKHMADLLDDLAFFYKVAGDKRRSKSLEKVARKVRKA